MKKRLTLVSTPALLSLLIFTTPVFAVEVAPRISDKEIIESLAELKAGQIALQQQINDLKESTRREINDLKESTRREINDLKESTNNRFDDINKRFDTLQWMLGLFITVALSIMGIMGRILWNQQKKLTQIETSLEAQKEELSFLKSLIEKLQILIEKLLPPRGAL
jgi:peptidoglycan hydrolase CwlO-like protein